MKVAMFSAQNFERPFFEAANRNRHEIRFLTVALNPTTAQQASGCQVACCFVNDQLDAETLRILKDVGVSLVALRSAGHNHLDLEGALKFGITSAYVPEYSPYAIAEFTAGLLLTINRKIHIAHRRVVDHSFNLNGLVGFDLHLKTVGVIGTGRIGKIFCKIMNGFGCRILAYDVVPDFRWATENGFEYREIQDVLAQSDVISLHVPLTTSTRHLINADSLDSMKTGSIILNTSRGAVVDADALLEALDSGKLQGAGLDVYEYEAPIFFQDHPPSGYDDKLLDRLVAHPRVLLTGHQSFLTQEALGNIASKTIDSITKFENHEDLGNALVPRI